MEGATNQPAEGAITLQDRFSRHGEKRGGTQVGMENEGGVREFC